MHTNDRARFYEIIAGLAELQGRELSPAALKLWWSAMRNWDLDEFTRAANYLAKAIQFMPKPSDFEQLRRSSVTNGHEAWSAVLEHAAGRWRQSAIDDEIIAETVHRMGGFAMIGMCQTSQLDWKKRDFLEVYEMVIDEKAAAGVLPFALPGEKPKQITTGDNDDPRTRRLQSDTRPGGTHTGGRARVSAEGTRSIRDIGSEALRSLDRSGPTGAE